MKEKITEETRFQLGPQRERDGTVLTMKTVWWAFTKRKKQDPGQQRLLHKRWCCLPGGLCKLWVKKAWQHYSAILKSRLKPCHNTITRMQTGWCATAAAGQLTLALKWCRKEGGRAGRVVVITCLRGGRKEEVNQGRRMERRSSKVKIKTRTKGKISKKWEAVEEIWGRIQVPPAHSNVSTLPCEHIHACCLWPIRHT